MFPPEFPMTEKSFNLVLDEEIFFKDILLTPEV
jgi:hypothetical protein